jgi:hypothetical protein
MRHVSHCGNLSLCAVVWLGPVGAAAAQKDTKVPAALQKQINQAVDKGVAYLKRAQTNGVWDRGQETPGATALAAWTLLECGVKANDPLMQKAADYIRKAAVAETKNYAISLDIFFFDKLGDPEDIPLLEALAVRLLDSQNRAGGWTYFSADVPAAERKRLKDLVDNRKGKPGDIPQRPQLPRQLTQLDPAIQQQIRQLPKRALTDRHPAAQGLADNSNTQFAMLALWVARKYGVPVENALQRTAKRFADSQSRQNGSWEYMSAPQGAPKLPVAQTSSYAMTCAGLLGLTLGHAGTAAGKGKNSKALLLADAQFQAGLAHLGQILQGKVAQAGGDAGKIYYFLWSLERVGVVCDLDLIHGIDWYAAGSKLLLSRQDSNGSWQGGEFSQGACDTCFALLFLKRANVAEDLREQLLKGIDLGPPIIEDRPKKDGAGKGKAGGGRQSSLVPALPRDSQRPQLEPQRAARAVLRADPGGSTNITVMTPAIMSPLRHCQVSRSERGGLDSGGS